MRRKPLKSFVTFVKSNAKALLTLRIKNADCPAVSLRSPRENSHLTMAWGVAPNICVYFPNAHCPLKRAAA